MQLAPPAPAADPLPAGWIGFVRRYHPRLRAAGRAIRRFWKLRHAASSPDPRCLKALLALTPGAALRMTSSRRLLPAFFEQVAYNSRRLAKLNVPPADVLEALAVYDRELDLPAGRRPEDDVIRRLLYARTVMTIHDSYYQVREAETQAFYGLLRAEAAATGLDDLLRRFIVVLTRTFRAQSGRLVPFFRQPPLPARLRKRLSYPRYIAAGSRDEALVLDPAMRGLFQSFWSVPFFSGDRLAGLIQLGFPSPYRWLPRELDLLSIFAERCLRAADRASLIENLAAQQEQVRTLAAHVLRAEEDERRRISRELHDEAGQSMLFLRLHLEMLERTAPDPLRPKLAEARVVAEKIIGEIRRIISALHPSAVETLGLAAAIRSLTARFRDLHPIRIRLRLQAYTQRLPLETETTVYRIVQECYQNIAKHSRASRINLLLRSTDKLLELIIEDDGTGFDVARAVDRSESFGLAGMRERAALLGGSLEIRSAPGQGTRVAMRAPISAPRSREERGNSNTTD